MSLENDIVAGLQNPNIPMSSLISATMNTFSPEAIERIVQRAIRVIGSSLSGYRRGSTLTSPYLSRTFVYLNELLPKISLHLSRLTYSLHTLCKVFLRMQHPKLREVHEICEKINARLDALILNPNTCSLNLANLLSGISLPESESPDFISHYLATLILSADLDSFRARQKIQEDASGDEDREAIDRRCREARDVIFAPVAAKLDCFLYGLYVKLAVNSQLKPLATLLSVIKKEIIVRPEIVGARISYPDRLVDVICLTSLRFFRFVGAHAAFWKASDGDGDGNTWEDAAAELIRGFPREFILRKVCLQRLAEPGDDQRAFIRIALAAAAGGEQERVDELLVAIARFGQDAERRSTGRLAA